MAIFVIWILIKISKHSKKIGSKMGCNNSTSAPTVVETYEEIPSPKSNGPLSSKELQQRIETCDDAMVMNFNAFSIRFAFLSQRGYYPDCKIYEIY